MILNVLLAVVAVYLAAGFIFAIAFVVKGVAIVDEGALGSSVGFRMIIIPGVMIFWPLLLSKWRQSAKRKKHAQP